MKSLLVLLVAVCSLNVRAQWKNQSELAALVTGGNTEIETYNLKSESTLKKEKRSYSFGGHYTLGTKGIDNDADGEFDGKEESARNWDAHARYTQDLSAKTAAFIQVMFEGDRFAGYKQRQNYDLGGKYKFVESEKLNSFATLAYRYTIEQTVTRNEDDEDVFNDNKAVTYYEINKEIRKGFSYKFWIEYIYNFTRTEDFLINFEPSLAFAMSETFSVKIAYKGMYDNEPATEGNEQMDWQYTTALLASF